jgi:hypothetical protein
MFSAAIAGRDRRKWIVTEVVSASMKTHSQLPFAQGLDLGKTNVATGVIPTAVSIEFRIAFIFLGVS